MPLHTQAPADSAGDEVSIRPEFAQPGELHSVPRFRLAERMLPSQTAYQLIHDELLLDASSRLNLATFIGTWMEPQARVLIEECLDKNIVDRDESTMVRLGREGFTRVQQACRDTARWLTGTIADMGPFQLISDGSTIPVFAFRLAQASTTDHEHPKPERR